MYYSVLAYEQLCACIKVSQGLVVDLVNIVPFSIISSRFALMCVACSVNVNVSGMLRVRSVV